MEIPELIAALRRHDAGCFSCGHEHNCHDGRCALMQQAADRLEELNRRAAPDYQDDHYMDGVKYAIYEIFKEADIPGSQEIRDSGDTDDGMCARAAKKIRTELSAAPGNKALTLEHMDCKTCQFADRDPDEEPCRHCKGAYPSRYARNPEGSKT